MVSFNSGTFKDYCDFCDDRYSGQFKLKENEGLFQAFDRWLKEHGKGVKE